MISTSPAQMDITTRTMVLTLMVSDHESDEDPTTVGYNEYYDTDEEANHAEVGIEADESVTSRIKLDVSTCCKGGHCPSMQSEMEC